MAGTKVLQGVETALTTRRRPVKVGLVVDERAHSPGIALGMPARPFAGLAACSIIDCSALAGSSATHDCSTASRSIFEAAKLVE